jgi:hypothetical protein
MAPKPKRKVHKRRTISHAVKVAVLTEAGYRCAVPACRTILALDLHHIEEVSEGGGDEAENLLALCPTCHSLLHRGVIKKESIYSWKSILVSLNQGFDKESADRLIFLSRPEAKTLPVSGDGVLAYSRLIASGLATCTFAPVCTKDTGLLLLYTLGLTTRGQQLVEAWLKGDRVALKEALGRVGQC